MVYVGELQEALAVSQTEKRPDVDYLLRRAREDHDFDTVLVQDLSRLTRGGLEHGLALYFEFKKVGVLIASITDGLIDGEEKLKEAINRFQEARAHSKAGTLNMLRGRIKSRRDGRCVYTFQIPYGLDRLYMTQEGEPLHIIRNLSDGTQVQLDPTGEKLLRTFGRNEDGVWNHYIKQKDEHMTLIPGDPKRIEVIQRIFRRKFVDGWGQFRIARELNDEGVLSAKGRRFAASTIQKTLQNSIYHGIGVGNRHSWAEFYKAGQLTPQIVPDRSKRKKKPLAHFRPEIEWYEQVFPNLHDYLGLESITMSVVKRWQRDNQKRLAAQLPLKSGGDRYPETDFILRGVLRSKQGDHLMSGCRMKNGAGYEYRYYRVTQGRTNPKTNDVLSKLVPAEMLEEAAMQVLKDALSTFTDIEPVVRAVVEEEAAMLTGDVQNIEKLKKERQALEHQIDFYVEEMSLLGDEGVRHKTAPLRRKMLDISARIDVARQAAESSTLDVGETVRAVEASCRQVLTSFDTLTRSQIRHLLRALIKRTVVDLETREAVMEVHMPLWAVKPTKNIVDAVCADDTNFQIGGDGAYAPPAIKIALFTCVSQRVEMRFCMACTRSASPAGGESRTIAA
jgi:hypothetical protein